MPLSDRMGKKRKAPLLPSGDMKELFDAKDAQEPPAPPPPKSDDTALWIEWDIRCKSHGRWCSLRMKEVFEREQVEQRIAKGEAYIAAHASHPDRPAWEKTLAELKQKRHEISAMIDVWDAVTEEEATHIAEVEEAIKAAAGVTQPAFICGTCRRLIVTLKDHGDECRNGWGKILAAYDEVTT